MLDVLSLIIPYFGLIAVGFVTAKLNRTPIEALGWLNIFVVYLALPALFIKILAETPVEDLTRWDFILTNLAVTFAIVAVTFLFGLLKSRGDLRIAMIQSLAGGYGNIGYMGPGLAILIFGEQAAVPIALIFCFENILHFTMAPAVMAMGGREKRRISGLVVEVIKKIIFHPFIIATAIGVMIAVSGIAPPVPVSQLIAYLAQAAAPCALFAMGVTLALRPLRRVPGSLLYIVPLKLIVHPSLMYVALTTFGPFDPVWTLTAVLLAALPTATNVFVIAQQYGVWAERASATILITTTLSVITVSALLYAIQTGLLPA
ncbi:MAG: AEC family transporter [Pseudomonadota bacterium]